MQVYSFTLNHLNIEEKMKKNRFVNTDRVNMPVILTGAGIVTLIICLVIFWPDSGTSSAQLESIEGRLVVLERQISDTEDRVSTYSDRIQELNDTVSRMSERFDRLEAIPLEMENMQKKIEFIEGRREKGGKSASGGSSAEKTSSQPVKTTATVKTAKTTKKSEPSSTGQRSSSDGETYIVQEGDTLYSIALRFKTNVDKLRNLNNLVADAVIRPGQKLVVSQ